MLSKFDFFNPKHKVGVFISQKMLCAVQCGSDYSGRRKEKWKVCLNSELPFESNITQYNTLLDELFLQIRKQTNNEYVPLSVSFADPYIKQTLLSFEELPAKEEAREKLITWRLEKDWHLDMKKKSLVWQCFGYGKEKEWVLAQTVTATMLSPVSAYAQKHQLILDNIDAIGNILLNKIGLLNKKIVLVVEMDFWSLYLIGNNGLPHYQRAKWKSGFNDKKEVTAWVAQIDRVLSTFESFEADEILLVDNELDSLLISASLEERIGKPVKNITGVNKNMLPEESLALLATVGI